MCIVVVALNKKIRKEKETNEKLKEENNKRLGSLLFETTIEECLRVQPELWIIIQDSEEGQSHHFTYKTSKQNKSNTATRQFELWEVSYLITIKLFFFFSLSLSTKQTGRSQRPLIIIIPDVMKSFF